MKRRGESVLGCVGGVVVRRGAALVAVAWLSVVLGATALAQGGSGDDLLSGGSGDALLADQPATTGGDELLEGSGGEPPGGSGDDLLSGAGGEPPGGSGDDLLSGAGGEPPGGSGDDLLSGAGGEPPGGSGDDLLSGAGGEPPGGAGDDLLSGAGGEPPGGSGDDLLSGAGGEPPGGSGDDLLSGAGAEPPGGSGDDLLGGSGDSLLEGAQGSEAAAQAGSAEAQPAEAAKDDAAAAHLALFAESRYPSANTCEVCHPKHYEQWSVSQHAYAQLSPVYMAMQNTINQVTSSTNGDFCIRCHNQVGMNMGESTFISNLDRHPTSREGITCVVCHRLDHEYGKVSGRVALVEGDLLTPVYGPKGNGELKRVLDNRGQYRVVTEKDEAGRKIHTDVGHFPQLSTSSFCGVCHDVNLFNGFRLEEAFSEYKNSPAARAGTSCQDCHMGTEPGVASGYDEGPAAVVGGEPTEPRKLTDHFFAGPDYSIVHPGIFPHNAQAAKMATPREWLQFDYESGWGTDAFEDNVPKAVEFPQRWRSVDARYDAREIIDYQLQRLEWAAEQRLKVLQVGYKLGDIETLASGPALRFRVPVSNGTDGHNVPTGFIAERLVWLYVKVTDSQGATVFESGDLDPNGDVRDAHSLYVHNSELPLDDQLFSLQSKFITRNVRGGEREQVLAVNYSLDPLPFIRPSTRSTVLTGQPGGARTHRLSLPPKSTRVAEYEVPAESLTGKPPYSATVQLKAAMIPVNLVDAIKGVGFDYGMSTREVAERVVEGHQVLWERSTTLDAR